MAAKPLVDQFGYPVSYGGGRRLIDAGNPSSRDMPQWDVVMEGIHKSVSYTDWKTLVSASRRLWANFGVIKGATAAKAMHAVGRAWEPQFMGEDKAWGDAATAWLRDQWYTVCDVRGENYDFKTGLFLDSISIDRDGDFGCVLTETEDGYPQIQYVPAHRVGHRSGSDIILPPTLANGQPNPYAGLRCLLGVVFNKNGRPVAYSVLGSTAEQDELISARDFILKYDPEWYDQARGFPSYTDSINFVRGALVSHEWEQRAGLMASALGLIEYNETGAAEPTDPKTVLGGNGDGAGGGAFTHQAFEGGMIRYFKASSPGSKLQQFQNQRPGEEWDAFQDRVIRIALLGLGWPYSLTWKPDGMNGTQERSEIEKARTSIKDRQDLLFPVARRTVGYAVSKAINLKILPPYRGSDLGGQLKWGFSMPPQFSIDHGRDGNSRREDYKLGHRNLVDIWASDGLAYRDQMNRRDVETRDLVERAQKISADLKIPFGTALSLFQQRTATASAPGGVFGTLLGEGEDGGQEKKDQTTTEENE